MQTLRTYLNTLTPSDQKAYAMRCGTTVGYLRKAISEEQEIGPKIAIALERESGGAVRCEDLRNDVDWAYIRNSA